MWFYGDCQMCSRIRIEQLGFGWYDIMKGIVTGNKTQRVELNKHFLGFFWILFLFLC